MAALKSKSLKNALVTQARNNTTVTVGKKDSQEVLKKGVPNDHSRRHLDGETPVVGVSIGTTLNMDNYESLRADVWLTDSKRDNESLNEAYERVSHTVSVVLQEIISQYR